LSIAFAPLSATGASGPTGSRSAVAGVIDFARDVKPILEGHCFECHGGNSTEGLDLNDRAAIEDYLTAGDASESDLFQRTIAADDTRMPPLDSGLPLTGTEIAVLKLWIDEGAEWPETVTLGVAGERVPAAPTLPAGYVAPRDRSLLAKLWGLHGWFHPAIVHFPIALLNVAALFVILNFLFRGNFREFAFWCLLLGALGSIVACTMGWSFAAERSQSDAEVFNHRWGGIAVAVFSSLMTLLALRLKSSDNGRWQALWQIGTLVAAGLVGLVGHQGGELVYGEGIYDNAIDKYFGAPDLPIQTVPDSAPETDEATGDATGGLVGDRDEVSIRARHAPFAKFVATLAAP